MSKYKLKIIFLLLTLFSCISSSSLAKRKNLNSFSQNRGAGGNIKSNGEIGEKSIKIP